MGLYVVERHIEAISVVAHSCGDITTRLGQTTTGIEVPPAGWAQHERAATHLSNLMHMFCEVDLGFAFPADAETRASSLRHLAEAEAAFAGDDKDLHDEFEAIYGSFDIAAAPFYRVFAHAFGTNVTPELVNQTNGLIDTQVQEGARSLSAGQVSHRIIFSRLVESLTKDRSASLQSPEPYLI